MKKSPEKWFTTPAINQLGGWPSAKERSSSQNITISYQSYFSFRGTWNQHRPMFKVSAISVYNGYYDKKVELSQVRWGHDVNRVFCSEMRVAMTYSN